MFAYVMLTAWMSCWGVVFCVGLYVDFDSDLIVFSILIWVLVMIWIWDCELGFDFGFRLRIFMLLTWDSEFGIWVWSCALVSLWLVPGHLGLNRSRNVRKQNKVGRSEALGMNYFICRFWSTFFAHPATLQLFVVSHFCF